MSTRTITLPADQWEAILEVVQDHWDEGPPGEGWQGSRLSAASAALSAALAQPEPMSEIIAPSAAELEAFNAACRRAGRLFAQRMRQIDRDLISQLVKRSSQSQQGEALAQPEPQGPTLNCDEIDVPWSHRGDDFHAYKEGYAAGWAEGVSAAAARYARPAIEPVPVAERPWEREGWCDAHGRCWFGTPKKYPADAGWILREPEELLARHAVSLPHHALPIPTP
jgi:hypothetical protein